MPKHGFHYHTCWFIALIVGRLLFVKSHDVDRALVKGPDRNDETKRAWNDNSMEIWGKRFISPPAQLNPSSTDNHISYQLTDVLSDDTDVKENLLSKDNSAKIKHKLVPGKVPALEKDTGHLSYHPEAESTEKRKWADNSMSVWGKRDGRSINEIDKRRWSDNSMSVWGRRKKSDSYDRDGTSFSKRKWADNSMQVWGKRSSWATEPSWQERIGEYILNSGRQSNLATIKRKWSDNTMNTWGKKRESLSHSIRRRRSIYDDLDSYSDPSDDGVWQSFLSRGRSGGIGDPKRNWETNTMRVWGKRAKPSRHTHGMPSHLDRIGSGKENFEPPVVFKGNDRLSRLSLSPEFDALYWR